MGRPEDVTSFNPNYLPIGPASKHSHVGVGLQHMSLWGSAHSSGQTARHSGKRVPSELFAVLPNKAPASSSGLLLPLAPPLTLKHPTRFQHCDMKSLG